MQPENFTLYWGQIHNHTASEKIGGATLEGLTRIAQAFMDDGDRHWQEESSGFYALRGDTFWDDPYVALPNLGYNGPGAWDEDSAGPFVMVPSVYMV